jgi:hypothetical protein
VGVGVGVGVGWCECVYAGAKYKPISSKFKYLPTNQGTGQSACRAALDCSPLPFA